MYEYLETCASSHVCDRVVLASTTIQLHTTALIEGSQRDDRIKEIRTAQGSWNPVITRRLPASSRVAVHLSPEDPALPRVIK